MAVKNKVSATKPAQAPQTPVFKIVIRKPGANPKTATPGPKPQNRDRIFSKSRDLCEDRGLRKMKTTHNPQTLFNTCALL
jgi:hypothetical protein